MTARRRAAPVLLGCYLVAAVLESVAAVAHWRHVDGVLLASLMPLLFAHLLLARSRRDRLTRWVLIALLWSWLGDTVGGVQLLGKIGFFLLAQLSYAVAFWPYRRSSLARRPVALAGFLLALALLIVLVGREAGPVLPAIVVYALALGLMAVLASGLNRIAAFGGMVFLVSDLSLGLSLFGSPSPTLAAVDGCVMPTYLAGQLLLVLGALRRHRAELSGPGGRTSGSTGLRASVGKPDPAAAGRSTGSADGTGRPG